MIFKTHAQCKAEEAARLQKLNALKAAVTTYDADPLTPGEAFHFGDIYDGFFAGRVVIANDTHVALLNESTGRIAILPLPRHNPVTPIVGDRVAMGGWGQRITTYVRLTPTYDWIDAFDDYSVTLQNTLSFDGFLMYGIHRESFALDGRGRVSAWYRDLADASLMSLP